ncbi:HesB/IscA family protein [Thalassiella azotivora]
MLTLTENAQTLVRDITARPELPAEGGLRIAPAQTPGQLEMALVEAPAPGDQVIDAGEARVFVEAQTAEILGDSTLDADTSGSGAGFVLTQPEQPA